MSKSCCASHLSVILFLHLMLKCFYWTRTHTCFNPVLYDDRQLFPHNNNKTLCVQFVSRGRLGAHWSHYQYREHRAGGSATCNEPTTAEEDGSRKKLAGLARRRLMLTLTLIIVSCRRRTYRRAHTRTTWVRTYGVGIHTRNTHLYFI